VDAAFTARAVARMSSTNGTHLGLEAQLTALTQDFVARLVDALRHASFVEVAALSTRVSPAAPSTARPSPATPRTAGRRAPSTPPDAGGPRGRQTASARAELGERVIHALQNAARPLGVRALSSELGVAPDLLAAPLRELRTAGRVQKHGDKRSTTYSV